MKAKAIAPAADVNERKAEINPRRFLGELDENIPQNWYEDNAVLTNMLNTYTVLVPDNERYYMRNLRKSLARIADPELQKRVIKFIQQEAQHGHAHERYWDNLRAHGIRFENFLKLTNFLSYKFLEALFPLKMQLSVIAAVEHINAYLGQVFLEQDLLKNADKRKRALFYWHFAEEIEHKEVAFDAFTAISGNYPLRALGMLLTAPLFYLFSLSGTLYFTAQQGQLFNRRYWWRWFKFQFVQEKVAWRSLALLAKYFKPGFHPAEIDNLELAEQWFARLLNAHTERLIRPTVKQRAAQAKENWRRAA